MITFEIDNAIVSGTVGLEGFKEPEVRHCPSCPKCHGQGTVKAGYEPPDEFNATGQDVYDACDCSEEVPGTGSDGHPTFEVEEVITDEGDLSPAEIEVFVARMGKETLAKIAYEMWRDSQG